MTLDNTKIRVRQRDHAITNGLPGNTEPNIRARISKLTINASNSDISAVIGAGADFGELTSQLVEIPMNTAIHGFSLAILFCGLMSACSRDTESPGTPAVSVTKQKSFVPLKIERWGPQSTPVGTPFNLQPGGKSGLWIESADVQADKGTQVLLGDVPLDNVTVTPRLVTAAIPAALLDSVGVREVYIVESSGRKTLAGSFSVTASPTKGGEAGVAPRPLQVIRWGPQSTAADTVFNEQPDGKSGLWIEINGVLANGDAQLLFGKAPLERVTVTEKLVTAAVPRSLIAKSGSREIVLVEQSGRETRVGTFTVTEKSAKAP